MAPESIANRTLGKYDVLHEIGRGSMGTVYLGHDPFAGREVAIKVAHPESLLDPTQGARYRKMFFNEAKIASRLKHPNIVQVFDAGVEDEICFIVMEYVPGAATLYPFTRPNALMPIEDVVRTTFKCAKALDYAHRQGVVHRDIKPRNILLTDTQEVKIGDFSIALLFEAESTDTQVHGYVGSPLYMSPEQVNEEMIGNQSDLFSLGIVMYELLTGRHPFAGETLGAIIKRITQEAPTPIAELRSEAPPILAHIVERCLAKPSEARYRNGLDLAADLSLVFEHMRLFDEELPGREKFMMVRDLRFFSDFPDSEIWEVLNASAWHEYNQGTQIITEGELEDAFYIIVQGHVVVRKAGSRVDMLSRGDCFGEMGFLAGQQRTATITAQGPVTALKVRTSLIERASLNCQLRFHKVFLHTLIGRLSQTTQKITQRESA